MCALAIGFVFARVDTAYCQDIDEDFVPHVGVNYRDRISDTDYRFTYEGTPTPEYDLVSRQVEVSLTRKPHRDWRVRTTGEFSFTAVTDATDRDVDNLYRISQSIRYRLDRRHRITLYGEYREKRPLDKPSHNAFVPSVGATLQRRFVNGSRLELDYRYEDSNTENPRYGYTRWTYASEFSMPLSRHDRVAIEGQYRPRLSERRVRVNGVRVPREDHAWTLSTSWERELLRELSLELVYSFEHHGSNDPDRRYNAHLVGLTLNYRIRQ